MVTPALTIRPYDSAGFETLYAIDQSCYPRGIAYSRRELRWYLGVRGASCLVAQLAAKPDLPQRGSNEREIAAYGGSDQTRAARSAEIAGFIIAQASGSEAHLITLDVVAAHRRLG